MCAFSQFVTIKDIPKQFRSKWAFLYNHVLLTWERGVTNKDAIQIERALKAFLALPQLLLRQGSRSGKRGQARSGLAARFDLAMAGEWSVLVSFLENDLNRLNERVRHSNPRTENDDAKIREQTLKLISVGQVSRAASRLASHGIADLSRQSARDSLQAKFPPKQRPLPPSVPRGDCVEGLGNVLRHAMLQIERGTAAGPGGGRGEFLINLAQQWDNDQLDRFTTFCMALMHGEVPPWFGLAMGAINTIGAYKTDEKLDDKLRPIGVMHEVRRLTEGITAAQNRAVVDDHCQPEQLGCSPAGAHKLVHAVRMSHELPRGENWVSVKLDFKNAHSSVFRAAILAEYSANPSLQHMTQHAAVTLAPPTLLVHRGKTWGIPAGEGVIQGNAKASQDFNVAIQPHLVQLNQEVKTGGGKALGGQDDVFVVGPSSVVCPAIDSDQTVWSTKNGGHGGMARTIHLTI